MRRQTFYTDEEIRSPHSLKKLVSHAIKFSTEVLTNFFKIFAMEKIEREEKQLGKTPGISFEKHRSCCCFDFN